MIPERVKAARELLSFYVEAGVDALVAEVPVDRFAGARPEMVPPEDILPASEREASSRPTRAWPETLPLSATSAAVAPDVAVMAAREAARSAATLDDLRAMLDKFEGC